MKKIDTTDWGEFAIGELFSINPTKYYKMTNKDLMEEDGFNPVIVNSSYNNGIGGYTNQSVTEKGNVITFSDTTNADSIFYQPVDFVGYSHVQVLKPLKYHDNWTSETLLFFLSVFKTKAKLMNFDYVNKFTREEAKNIIVKLPIKPNKEPDWDYMENYIKELKTRERESFPLVASALKANNSRKVNSRDWKGFTLKSLFDIVKGTRLTKANMIDGELRFIGSSAMNNGLTNHIANNEKIHPANTITVCYNGSVGETFYQNEPFWASDDVNVLYPKFNLTLNIALFLCPLIRHLGQSYAFIDKWRLDVMEQSVLLLPIDANEEPDWAFMEDYIQTMTSNMKEELALLSQL